MLPAHDYNHETGLGTRWHCVLMANHDGKHQVTRECLLNLSSTDWELRPLEHLPMMLPLGNDNQRLDFLSMFPDELENVRWRVLNEDAGPGKSSVREAIDYFMKNHMGWRQHLNTKTV